MVAQDADRARGDAPDAKLVPAREQLPKFHVPPGFEVQLVASDPEILKPLNLNFDAAGRLWLTGTRLYPWPARVDAAGREIPGFQKQWDANHAAFGGRQMPQPPEKGLDAIQVLSDFGPDGRARKIRTFADGLNIVMGVQALPGAKGDSVLAFSIPAIWRLTDSDGDGRADRREPLFEGFGFRDTHGLVSNFLPWFDGWIYGNHGTLNRSEVRDGSGRVTVLEQGNTYRFRPDGSRFELWNHGQTNPFGLAFDELGNLYSADSHSKPVYLLQRGGHYEGMGIEHDGLGWAPRVTDDDHGSSAIAGIACYAAERFPAEFRGNLFNGNPVTRRINRARLEWQGATARAMRLDDFLTCDDPSFRPVQVKLGPDGALWIADFYNPIIGHYEVPLNDPRRDKTHGRVWRVVWRGDKSAAPPTIADLTRAGVNELIEKLSDANLLVRTFAANGLAGRIGRDAVPAIVALAHKIVAAPRESDAALARAELPAVFLLERLGAWSAAPSLEAFVLRGGASARAALRVLADRPALDGAAERLLRELIQTEKPGVVWLDVAHVFARHPQAWQLRLTLDALAAAPAAEVQLIYALRMALKQIVSIASERELAEVARVDAAAAERIAEVSLAVKTPAVAEFLVGHLERTNFRGARAAELVRHAVMHLGAEGASVVSHLTRRLADAPLRDRFALAEGIAAAAKGKRLAGDTDVERWARDVVRAALASNDDGLLDRAVGVAANFLPPEERFEPLREIVLRPAPRDSTRRAVALNGIASDPRAIDVAVRALADPSYMYLRKTAAQLLGKPAVGATGRRALAQTLPGAPTELAIVVATALAQTDDGAQDLLELVAREQAPRWLLTHKYVTTAFESRGAHLRARVAELTRDLPPEDVRLDTVIYQRLRGHYVRRPQLQPARGAEVFRQFCAACHRMGDTGANIGPSLDGIGARGYQRLMEDILDPSRNVDPAFRVVTVTLKNGETHTGVNLREEGGAVVASDAAGKDVRFPKTQVASTKTERVSLMPQIFESAIPEEDFYHLIAFLSEGR
jgi:putative membrane-bound dehydrogenase-like protein